MLAAAVVVVLYFAADFLFIRPLDKQIKERREHLKQVEEKMAAAVNTIPELNSLRLRVKEKIDFLSGAKDKITGREQIRIFLNQLAQESRKLDARKNEHDLLRSLIDSMEGYPESVKFLHNNPNWNHTAPILSDIIYVKEAYRAAVENVLEPYLNYYVVNDLQEGLQAVHLLDAHQKGKANFFLLDKLNGVPQAQEALHEIPGTLPALDVVEYDQRYRNLVQYLLGNVLIAENEEALQHSNGHVVLEKHGKYVKGKYALTGGSVGLFEGKKIGRVKNLEKLVEEIAAQEAVVNGLRATIQARHNEVIGFNEQLKEHAIRQTQEEISSATNKLFALQNKLEGLHQADAQGRSRREALEQQLQEAQDAITGVRESLESLNAQAEMLADKLRSVEASYAHAEQEYNFANASYNEVNLQYTRQQSKLQSLKQEASFKQNQLEDLRAQVEQSNGQMEEISGHQAESSEQLIGLDTELHTLLTQKASDELTLNQADQAYYNLRNQLQEKESAIRHLVREKEQADQLLGMIKDRLTELKLQLAGIRERLMVEFKVDIDTILDEPRANDDTLEELQAACDRMKKRLENMGEVNPTAIEAFQEMKKRYDFIVEQKKDLVTAKDTLMQTIQEVESTANQKFLETFNQVRENFQRVFKALFTEEDTADLIMENPENLAETGIDIVAKPKGKRPTSITQLSGGEKTLTATALLFAIYLIKPAPFCILDEVDAPLDDANVGKFTNMIRQFSKDSQFIIVTHNKMTMSTVDVIYGVTMQEAGVSKLVAVDFRNLSERATA